MQSVLKTNGLPVWEQRFFESLSLGGCRVSGVESLPSLSHNTSVQCWPGLSCRPKQYTWYLALRTDMLCSLGFSQVCQDRQSPPGDLQAAAPPYGRVPSASMCTQLGPGRAHSDPGGSCAHDILPWSTLHLRTTTLAHILVIFDNSQHLFPF